MHKYELRVEHDPYCENPNNYEALKVVSFGTHHIDFVHPDDLDPKDVLATLSYYEHGLCRWMVGSSVVPDPYGGFDTVDVAGAIVYDESEHGPRDWYDALTDDERSKLLDAIADQYTAWANGDAYYYQLSEVDYCGECGTGKLTEIDTCGGYLGDFSEYVNSEVLYGIDPADVKLTGDASYVVDLDPIQVSA